MSKFIKALTKNITRLEMGGRNQNRPPQEGGFRNQNQFRRPNNPPQILQME